MNGSPAISMHDGLAVYNYGGGEPFLLMPGPHRFQSPGECTAHAERSGDFSFIEEADASWRAVQRFLDETAGAGS